MKGLLIIGIFLLLLASVSALQGPFNYQGGSYYVVTSTDSSEDTGDEVCAKAGMVCVGYTEKTNAVCMLVHPNAATSSGVSGDASGTYCNGPPQGNVCSTLTNTCLTCPACTASVDCATPIGGLYREMFVECTGSAACPIKMNARNTQDLLSEVSLLNTGLNSCPAPLPGRASSLLSNGNIQVDIAMKSGTTESLTIVVSNKQITGISRGAPSSCKQKVAISEANLDTILGNRNRATVIMQMYANKQLTVKGCGIIRRIFTGITAPITRFIVRRNLPPPPPPPPPANCGQPGEQCNNRACSTGICAAPYEFVNGQWRAVNYRCLTLSEWPSRCQAHGNTRAPWNCYTGNAC